MRYVFDIKEDCNGKEAVVCLTLAKWEIVSGRYKPEEIIAKLR
jgi:hypothetical protein